MKFRTFSALRHRNFRLFFAGQAVSLIGTWMHSLAQGWLVLQLTNSAFYLSLVQAMGSLPILFFSPLAGVVADRVPKRSLLLVTQILSMFLALFLAALTGLGLVAPWHVVLIAGLLGLVNTFDVPGRQAFIIEMVGKEDLMNGIALNSAVFNGARIIGPAIAGALIGFVGLSVCFYINAATYAAIILGLFMMRFREEAAPRESRPVARELAEGLRYVRGHPSISLLIFMVAVSSLFAVPYIALMPIFARDVLKVGAKGLGVMMGAAGLGALVGALTLASVGHVRRRGLLAFASATVAALGLLAFSFTTSPWLACVLLAVIGWGMITELATVNTMIQTEVPDALRGRVMSFYTLVFLGFIPVGNIFVGALAHHLGAPRAVAVSACVCLGTYMLLPLFRRDLLTMEHEGGGRGQEDVGKNT